MPDGKPGRALAQRAEGFFRLDFLVLLCQVAVAQLADC